MDDLIRRQAVFDMLAEMQGRCTSKTALIQNSKIWQQIKDMPPAQPTVDAVERKRGEWEQVANDDSGIDFRCSVCHRYRFHNGEMRRKYKFCPNCGADMRGENNGNNVRE